jgi:hypothetical protein
MVLTNRKLLALQKALELIKDVDVDTAMQMAQNILQVREAVKQYEEARTIISRECGVIQGQPVTAENAQAVSDWMKKVEALKDSPGREVALVVVARNKLQKDKSLTPSILADLAPVIKELSPEPAA